MPTATLENGQKIVMPEGLSPEEMDAVVADAVSSISQKEPTFMQRLMPTGAADFIQSALPPGTRQAMGLVRDIPGIINEPGRAVEGLVENAANTASAGTYPYLVSAVRSLGNDKSYQENLYNKLDQMQATREALPGVAEAGGMAGSFANPLFRVANTVPKIVGASVATGQMMTDPRASAADRLKQAAVDTTGALVGYGVGRAIANKNELVPREDVVPELAGGRAEIQRQTGINVPVAPDTATTSSALDTLGYINRKSPLSSGIMRKFGLSQEEAVSKVADTLEQRVGLPGRQEITNQAGVRQKVVSPLVDDGQAVEGIVSAANTKWSAFHDEAAKRFDNVSILASDNVIAPRLTDKYIKAQESIVSSPSLRELHPDTAHLVDRYNEIFAPQVIPGSTTTSTIVDASGKPSVSTTPDKVVPRGTFKDLQDFRRLVSETAFNAKPGSSDKRVAEGIKQAINRDFEVMADKEAIGGNSAAARQLRETNKWYADQNRKFEINVLDKVSNLVDQVTPFSTKGANVLSSAIKQGDREAIVKIKDLVGEESFKPIADNFRQIMLRGNTDHYDILGGSASNPDANPLKTRIRSLKNPNVLDDMLGKRDATLLKALADIAPHLEDAAAAKGKSTLNISNLAVLGGGGALTKLLSMLFGAGGTATGAAATTAAAANIGSAKVYTNPKLESYILNNWKPNMGRAKILSFTSHITRELLKPEVEIPKTNQSE